MSKWALVLCSVILVRPATPRDHRAVASKPEQFEIARHSFFDFGPPFDVYELFSVRPTPTGSLIERVTLTPPVSCMQPAGIETAQISVNESVADFLGEANPCTIPAKELRRELKRCKKCMVFSGADVSMQAKCGGQERIIRAQILDKDMFDPSPGTPKNTSWTMQLLSRMDHALGSSVMDRPVFSSPTGGQTSSGNSQMLQDLTSGKYDALFQGGPHKPSQLYHMAQEMPRNPDVEVQISPTVRPEVLTLPAYPPIARSARVEGTVIAKFTVIEDGGTSALIFKNGHPILRAAVERAASAWKFPIGAVGQELQATVVFKMNCSAETE